LLLSTDTAARDLFHLSLHDALPISREVGIQVDHLRLEPQAELHPESVDEVGEGFEALGPDRLVDLPVAESGVVAAAGHEPAVVQDRKSTRLNSSHVKISYAVFCLKK